jgi:hypothetical protein
LPVENDWHREAVTWQRLTGSLTEVVPVPVEVEARGVPETGHWSCCAFVFADQAADDIAAVDLFGGWRFRYGLTF